MNTDQMELFCNIAYIGIACGLYHPFEWYVNYVGKLVNFCKYEDIPLVEETTLDMFVAFMKQTASCPEEQEYLDKLDHAGFLDMVANVGLMQRSMIDSDRARVRLATLEEAANMNCDYCIGLGPAYNMVAELGSTDGFDKMFVHYGFVASTSTKPCGSSSIRFEIRRLMEPVQRLDSEESE